MTDNSELVTTNSEVTINSLDFSELTPIPILDSEKKVELKMVPIESLRPHLVLKQFNEPMKKEDRAALYEDIKLRGVIVPVQTNQFGEILDGIHRWEEAARAKLKMIPVQEFVFVNDDAQELHILKSNGMRKTISTQHKYLTIARASKLFEVGRGGDRSKSKEVSDTSEKNDVLTVTAKHMHVSPEVVKIARRYEKEILKYPKYHQVEPTKFLKSIVPVMILKNDTFRDTLIKYVVENNKDLSGFDTINLEMCDSLLCRCEDPKRQLGTSNFIIEKLQNRQKIEAGDLAYNLGLSVEIVNSAFEKKDSNPEGTNPSGENDSSNKEQDNESKKPRTPQQIFSDYVAKLGKKVESLEGSINVYEKVLKEIIDFSNNYTVSIKRLCEHNAGLESKITKVTQLAITLGSSEIKFRDSGFQQGWDDRLKLFDAIEESSTATNDEKTDL